MAAVEARSGSLGPRFDACLDFFGDDLDVGNRRAARVSDQPGDGAAFALGM